LLLLEYFLLGYYHAEDFNLVGDSRPSGYEYSQPSTPDEERRIRKEAAQKEEAHQKPQ
jgi:hypothetical protein